jgi:glycosyltransferase involved in cell wall biosynthesis
MHGSVRENPDLERQREVAMPNDKPRLIEAADPDTMKNKDERPWPVAVFAHNEELNIIACLESIARERCTHPLQVHVLANGCTDRTEPLVRDYQKANPWVSLTSIPLGDKANAWNIFVHEIAQYSSVCFFVDGDVQVVPGAFDALFRELAGHGDANAAGAIPLSGRSKRKLQRLVCENRVLLGNLYALHGEFVQRMKQERIRLPVGMYGEDGLVTSLAKWNLDPLGEFLHHYVVPCTKAQFAFRSLSLFPIGSDYRLYYRRRLRYSTRHFQLKLLIPLLKQSGMAGMPQTVDDLYRQQLGLLDSFWPRLGMNAFFDFMAIYRIRQQLNRQPQLAKNS